MKKLVNLLTVIVLLMGMMPPIKANAEVTPLWEQLPNGEGASLSEIDRQILAEDFVLAEATSIAQIEIWTNKESPLNLTFEIYANAIDAPETNIPGELLNHSEVLNSVGVEDVICPQNSDTYYYCKYRHTLSFDPPLELADGHYWLSVYGSKDSDFGWSRANIPSQYQTFAINSDSTGIWEVYSFYAFAFRLTEPQQACSDSIVVMNTADSGLGSLRQALIDVCPDGTITFNASLSAGTIHLTTGQLTIDKNMTIDGSALASKVTITTDNMGRVLQVNSGVTATLDSLKISHGSVTGNGGGIFNQGTLTVDNIVLLNNLSSQYGGGVYNSGTLIVLDSSVDINGAQYGGGIYNDGGTLEVTNCSLEENTASDQGGGIYNAGSGTVTVSDTTLSGNTALISGGGIAAGSAATTTVTGTTLTLNQATSSTTGSGGGLYNLGMMIVVNSTLYNNTAPQWGGGIYNSGGFLILLNSTLSGNEGNTSGFEGHGLANVEGGLLNYANTIIANSPFGCACYNEGTIGMNINNLVEEDFTLGCVDTLSDDPMLGSLSNNSGPTQTMALQAGSPAIDTGDDTTCSDPWVGNVDQRGVTRPQGDHCDIGAYEYEHTVTNEPPVIDDIDIYPEISLPGKEVRGDVEFHDLDSSSYTVEVDWGDGTVEPGGDCYSDFCDLQYHTYENVGTYTVQVSITDGEDQTGTGSTQHEVAYVIAVEEEAHWLASNTFPTTFEIYGETLAGHIPLNFSIVTQPEQGSITGPTSVVCEQYAWDEDIYVCRAEVVYTPVSGDVGDYSFTFTVDDGQGNTSSPGTVDLFVRGNAAPTAQPDSIIASTEIPKTIMLTATDPDFYNWAVDRLSFFIHTTPTNGTLGPIETPQCYGLYDEFNELAGVICTAAVLYTPNEGTIAESDSFTFYVNDTHQDSDPALISLDLHAPDTLMVNSTDDVIDDDGCTESHCSLREAVADTLVGDIIEFDLTYPATITLVGEQITILKDLVISGPGADLLAISGGGGESENPAGTRVFQIGDWDNKKPIVFISGLTIRDGRASEGGGVYVLWDSTLTMEDCVIGPNNIVTYAGGGIFNAGGYLTLNRCTVTENEGTGSLGGAGVTTAYGGTTTLTNSTISGNITNNYGGGLFVGNDSIVTLIHTTVSGNISNQNYSDPGEERGGGAGIYIEPYADVLVYLQNSIVAGNEDMTDPATAGHEKWPDVFGNVTSLGGNIIGDPTGSTNTWETSDQVGTAESPLDPLLGELSKNDPGQTLTMALLTDSPAIDAVACADGITEDQRGVTRPQGAHCDIGAYELEVTPWVDLMVNVTDDVVDGSCDATHCSLREAVNDAESGDTITFAESLSGSTIILAGHIWINKSLNIEGLGADKLAVSGNEVPHYDYNPEGNDHGGVFRLRGIYNPGVQPIEVHISGVTIRDGRASYGGGIYNGSQSTLVMNDCVIGPNNHALDAGGGISNKFGNLTLNRCTVWGNSQSGGDDPIGGGGITTINSPASTTLINCTVSGNEAYDYGGGILVWEDGIVDLVHSTVTNNTAGDVSNLNGGGGGVNNYSGTVNIQNSIVAGNFDETPAVSGVDPDVSGTFTSQGGNLIGDGTGATGWGETDLVGDTTTPINPLLDVLALYTPGTTSTHALLSGSPAIDAVTCHAEITIDQRGIYRPQGFSCDIGAFELEQITTGELKISKVFDPLTSGFASTFTIAYDCDDGETHDGTVSLGAGASETISGIPTGTICTVTEPTQPTPPTGWTFETPTFSPSDGTVTISETLAEVTVTNTISRDLGYLMISKVFDPLTSGFTGTFIIAYDCDDDTDHNGTVELAAGESQTITGIPTGTTCTISEDSLPTAPDGWTFGEPAFDPEGGSVTITASTSSLMDISMVPLGAEVTVTNSISQDRDILPDTLPIATVGFHYSQQLTAVGGTPPYIWSSIGLSDVPFSLISNTGVLVSDDNLIDPATPGVITFTAIWNDSAGVEFQKEFSLSVSTPLAFSPETLSTGKVGEAYSQVITLSGGTAPYAITPESLPDWLSSETDPDAGTITLTGTPTTFGSYIVQLQATDVTDVKGAKTYNLWIGPQRAFTWFPESPIQNEGVTFTPAADLGSPDMRWWRGDNPGDPCETYVVTYTSTLYIEFPAIGSYQICLKYRVDSINDYAWDRQWVTIAEPPTFIYYFPLMQMP